MEAISKNENYFYKVSIYTNTCKKTDQLHQDSKKQKNSELSPLDSHYNSNVFPSLDDSLNSLSLKYEKQLLSSCGRQWIWKEFPTLKKIDQLNLSARFAYVNMDIRLHNEGCLMATEQNFVAQVRIEESALLDGAGEFEQARAILIDQLRVTKVIRDDLRDERNELRGQFVEVVKSVIEVSATDCLELLNIKGNLVKSENLNYRRLCREIYFNRKVSTNLKVFAKHLLELEEKTLKRSKWFARFEIESEEQNEKRLEKELTNVLEENIDAYRRRLVKEAPEYFKSILEEVEDTKLMLFNMEDVQLFNDLKKYLNQSIFNRPLNDFVKRWAHSPSRLNPILLQICKSLEELLAEIRERTDIPYQELLISDSNGWHPANLNQWKTVDHLTVCLKFEYRFIFQLLDHFSSTNDKLFHYSPSVLTIFSKSAFINESKRKIKYQRSAKNSLKISDEFYIWYCMIDHILANAFSAAEIKRGGNFEHFRSLFQRYTNLIREVGHDQVDAVRRISHALARYVVQVDWFQKHVRGKLNGGEFQRQLDLNLGASSDIENFLQEIEVKSNVCSFLIGIYDLQCNNLELPGMELQIELFLEIHEVVWNKNVLNLLAFYRAISNLASNIGSLKLNWYYKKFEDDDCVSNSYEIVDNRLRNTEYQSYQVIDPQEVIKFVKSVPKHYGMDAINTMLSLTLQLLRKETWKSSNVVLSKFQQISSATDLLVELKTVLKYLTKQADFISYDVFYESFTEPFRNAVENSSSTMCFTRQLKEVEKHLIKSINLNEKHTTQLLMKEENLKSVEYFIIAGYCLFIIRIILLNIYEI